MDGLRITEDAPERNAQKRKEQEMRSAYIRKIANYILAGCMAALLLFRCYAYVGDRIEARNLLRQAKTIELAIRLTGIEYYGYGSSPYDSSQFSGLKEEAEKEIRERSTAEGEIRVLSWEEERNTPVCFVYQEGEFLVTYRREQGKDPTWEVGRLQNIIATGEMPGNDR